MSFLKVSYLSLSPLLYQGSEVNLITVQAYPVDLDTVGGTLAFSVVVVQLRLSLVTTTRTTPLIYL